MHSGGCVGCIPIAVQEIGLPQPPQHCIARSRGPLAFLIFLQYIFVRLAGSQLWDVPMCPVQCDVQSLNLVCERLLDVGGMLNPQSKSREHIIPVWTWGEDIFAAYSNHLIPSQVILLKRLAQQYFDFLFFSIPFFLHNLSIKHLSFQFREKRKQQS